MDDTKPWWQSKAIWGGLIALTGTVLSLVFRITIPAEAQNSIVDAAVAIATGVGSILAVWGRATATDKITLK